MAHFAELDNNNIVLRVIVVNDKDTQDQNGVEVEAIGREFLTNTYGGNWVQTSINNRIRKRFACIGHVYDSIKDVFIPQQIYPSWTLNNVTHDWDPPVPKPGDPKHIRTWEWREEQQLWEETTPAPSVTLIQIEIL